MADGIDTTPEGLDLYDLERLEKLRRGEKGYQNEPGFRLHRVLGYALVPVVECSSDRHPEPQPRFVSPYELDQDEPELEVADRLYAVRIHGRAVVGRRDDIREVAREEGRSFLIGFSLRNLPRLISWATRLADKVREVLS